MCSHLSRFLLKDNEGLVVISCPRCDVFSEAHRSVLQEACPAGGRESCWLMVEIAFGDAFYGIKILPEGQLSEVEFVPQKLTFLPQPTPEMSFWKNPVSSLERVLSERCSFSPSASRIADMDDEHEDCFLIISSVSLP